MEGELIGALTSTGGLSGIIEIKRTLQRIGRDRTRALLVLPLVRPRSQMNLPAP
jgi:hypothetical protein